MRETYGHKHDVSSYDAVMHASEAPLLHFGVL